MEKNVILNDTTSIISITSLTIFIASYILVILEDKIKIKKFKPVILASGIIWFLAAIIAKNKNMEHLLNISIKENLLNYCELFLFLVVAMTFINVMEERKIFENIKNWILNKKFNLKKLFWISGIITFCMSPITDNLTIALLMCAITKKITPNNKKFITLNSINIVVAANSGGAFSPFGDITTLMIWQSKIIPFETFFKIFFPSVVSYIIPAIFMNFNIKNEKLKKINEITKTKIGAKRIIILFIITIIISILFEHILNIPPAIGMMTGLGLLNFFSIYIKQKEKKIKNNTNTFDIIKKIKKIEWETLLFFYGIILCIGGLKTIGFLENISKKIYFEMNEVFPNEYKQVTANIIIGLLSSIVDNIPVMFSIISMNPTMNDGQWLLATLTVGVGGSLLPIGSAAGVALMSQTKGMYNFSNHIKWSWAILFGYIIAIIAHIFINNEKFN